MKIIITTEEDVLKDIQIEDGTCNLDEFTSILMASLTAMVDGVLKTKDSSKELYDFLFEHFAAVFDLFFQKVFPTVPEGYFELSDAALLYAQDQLIDDAEKNGITFAEALKKYEDKATIHLKNLKGEVS